MSDIKTIKKYINPETGKAVGKVIGAGSEPNTVVVEFGKDYHAITVPEAEFKKASVTGTTLTFTIENDILNIKRKAPAKPKEKTSSVAGCTAKQQRTL